ncbi:MAG: hypothetical protein ACRDD7_01750 [Peptostreptococcaceae bacterium]
MFYKEIKYLIKKEDLQRNAIISKTFILYPQDKAIIFGTIKLKDGSLAVGYGVVLEEMDKDTNIYIDKSFAITNEEGKYYLSFLPKDNKEYNIIIFKSIDLENDI